MNPSGLKRTSAFTLLELVVVLAILAIVTAVATRALTHVEDQQRLDTSQRSLEEIEFAILGSESDRAPDGTRIVSGFVADMGRLPKTVEDPGTNQLLTLRELWIPNAALYDLRRADVAHGVAVEDADLQVRVPGGWRGPYLRLPIGSDAPQDGWGNAYTSRIGDPDNARLLNTSSVATNIPGQPIGFIRHLGSNGALGETNDSASKDVEIALNVQAQLKGSVQLRDGDELDTDQVGTVVIRVFAPDPTDASKISVYKVSPEATGGIATYDITNIVAPDLTAGPRVVRAEFASHKSGIKTVILRPGVNQLDLTIDVSSTN